MANMRMTSFRTRNSRRKKTKLHYFGNRRGWKFSKK